MARNAQKNGTVERGIIRRGDKLYISYFDVDKTRRTRLLKGITSIVDARELLAVAEKRVTQGLAGIVEPVAPTAEEKQRKTITVEQMGERFTEQFNDPEVKDATDYRMEAKSILTVRVYPAVGKRAACEVTPEDMETLRNKLLEDYAASSVKNTLNTISKLYWWGRKQKLIDCVTPLADVKRMIKSDDDDDDDDAITSEKYLSRTEAADLMAALEALHSHPLVASEDGAMIYPMAATALYAGLRKGELYGLRWHAISFDRNQIEVAKSYDGRTKGKKKRHVPLHPELARILRQWRDRPDRTVGELVFPVHGRMGRSEETLGIGAIMQATFKREPPKVWHSLRHSFASHFMMAGGNLVTLQKLLGHKSIATTSIYAHLSPDHLAKEVNAMPAFVTVAAGVTPMSAAG